MLTVCTTRTHGTALHEISHTRPKPCSAILYYYKPSRRAGNSGALAYRLLPPGLPRHHPLRFHLNPSTLGSAEASTRRMVSSCPAGPRPRLRLPSSDPNRSSIACAPSSAGSGAGPGRSGLLRALPPADGSSAALPLRLAAPCCAGACCDARESALPCRLPSSPLCSDSALPRLSALPRGPNSGGRPGLQEQGRRGGSGVPVGLGTQKVCSPVQATPRVQGAGHESAGKAPVRPPTPPLTCHWCRPPPPCRGWPSLPRR